MKAETKPAGVAAIRPRLQRGLRAPDAAFYVGVSPTKFAEWVSEGKMPAGRKIDGVVLWDIVKLDAAFDALIEGPNKPSKWD